MRHSCLVAVACATALLVACSSSSNAAPPHTSPTTGGLPPLAIPSPTVPFVRCATSDLEMRLVFLGVGLGNVGGLIEVRNTSNVSCTLHGYAGLQLLDKRGNPEASRVIWADSSYLFGANLAEDVVALPAGTEPITPDRPVPGHAYIPISWNEVAEPCSSPAQFKVTPPETQSSVVISAVPPGGGPGLLRICGTVIVNPTRAAFYR